mmetsp:Transcript_16838/g.39908  ORF Transcript_16838/g.39908 Transcript_16838/m.39908 type:complete len:148 (-) Transcript_16838:320-763(-)|eukprot:CAMPEP_0185812456 /NCGR_PEP_ID=MMETSP1322-20130828/9351_1 /TAXON_ID=265543 /ORGANISM="Minutocellus polymorphus, Strain RCC2270" /LENGTH=147 /DNA_ID=CAMNT_0028508993 /DNA_START=98 /DNA_END=541 /DNA_ORIENTATION=-
MRPSQSLIVLLAFLLAGVQVSVVQSFSFGPAGAADTSSFASTDEAPGTSAAADITVDRRSVISTVVSSVLATGLGASPAYAKGEVDPAKKGTKQDPAYEACVSKALYECTKPKGDEQKSRAECIPECKKLCATSSAQLMTGTPIKKE